MATGEHRGLPAHQGSHLSVGARPLNGHVLGVTQYGARIFALLILKLATEQLSHFTRSEGTISLHEHGLRSQAALLVICGDVNSHTMHGIGIGIRAQSLSANERQPDFCSVT